MEGPLKAFNSAVKETHCKVLIARWNVQCTWRNQKWMNLVGFWTLKSRIVWTDNIKMDHTWTVSHIEDEISALVFAILWFKFRPGTGDVVFLRSCIKFGIEPQTWELLLPFTSFTPHNSVTYLLFTGRTLIYHNRHLNLKNLNKYGGVLWIQFVWVRIWQVLTLCCWHGNEPSGFMKCGTLGDWISDQLCLKKGSAARHRPGYCPTSIA